MSASSFIDDAGVGLTGFRGRGRRVRGRVEPNRGHGNELSTLATLRDMTPPQDVSVDAATAEALFRDVVGPVGFSIGDAGTMWVSVVSSSGVLFRALVGAPSSGSPIDGMRELADFVLQFGTEVAVTEP